MQKLQVRVLVWEVPLYLHGKDSYNHARKQAERTGLGNRILHGNDRPQGRLILAAKQGVGHYTEVCLERVREACKLGSGVLGGIVEVDEAYFGGKEENKHANKRQNAGRGIAGKQAVIGISQRGGRVKAKPIPNTSKPEMQGFIHANVAPEATVYTDDHRSYQGLAYNHGIVKHSTKEFVNGMAHTNGIESVWALLKRGYNGTYHNFNRKYLPRSVDTFTFRLNEGKCQVDTADRMAALARHRGGKPPPDKELMT